MKTSICESIGFPHSRKLRNQMIHSISNKVKSIEICHQMQFLCFEKKTFNLFINYQYIIIKISMKDCLKICWKQDFFGMQI